MRIFEIEPQLPQSDWIMPDGTLFITDHFWERLSERAPKATIQNIRSALISAADFAGDYIKSLEAGKFILKFLDGYQIIVGKSFENDTITYNLLSLLEPTMANRQRTAMIKVPVNFI